MNYSFVFHFFVVLVLMGCGPGNHDIGHPATVDLMEKTFIPHFNSQKDPKLPGRYVTPNSRNKDDKTFIGKRGLVCLFWVLS